MKRYKILILTFIFLLFSFTTFSATNTKHKNRSKSNTHVSVSKKSSKSKIKSKVKKTEKSKKNKKTKKVRRSKRKIFIDDRMSPEEVKAVIELNDKIPKYLETFTDVEISNMYKELELEDKVTFNAFNHAMKGLEKVPHALNNLIVIVDFTKPSNQERMFVIDLEKKEILISSLVSHGMGTGDMYAKDFSNKSSTLKSSVGFHLTGNIYDGKNGASLRLIGMEKGRNDNVVGRTIVIHGAEYANQEFLDKYGRLGRSRGCLALPTNMNDKIINLIQGGTLLYIHSDADEKNEYDFSKIE